MKRPVLLLASLVLLPVAGIAEPVKCNDGGNMLEMSACAVDAFNAADAELNDVYRRLLAAGAKEPAFIKKMRIAQKAWIRFRDADLEAKFACEQDDARVCWGSMITLDWPAHKTRLTRERTAQLNKLLEERFPAVQAK
jgi:uncharacterized protein YecT (DUF1311 family)